jgi:adhesin transport system membrane fusion protein
MKRRLSEHDKQYMDSLGEALSEHTPRRIRVAIYFWAVAILLFLVWASLTRIDEITRGQGEVVPSGENQVVQNLEGGIVKEILVKVGDSVEKGTPLLKIENRKSKAQMNATKIKIQELEAKEKRLQAESEGKAFTIDPAREWERLDFLNNERSLYESRQRELHARLQTLREQKSQQEHALEETQQRIRDLKRTAELMAQEVEIMRPMVKQGVKSRVEFMRLQREQSKILEELHSAQNSLPKIRSSIREIGHKIEEATIEFRNRAKQELNEVQGELLRAKESYRALQDEVTRTIVRSPIKGIVQKLYIHTVGGVIKPGEDLVEIVPTDDNLWLEVKIKPSDIAFIYPGQKAVGKVSAYDFAIYGSLEGEVVHISADTTKDEKERPWYIVHIKTKKNYLGSEKKPLKIIPGMIVNVDIMTGKKSLMDYILKPILRAKQYTFTER